jgi:hypothetical protein
MRTRLGRPPLVAVLLGAMPLMLMVACTGHEEPRPAPIVARRLGGDSLAPGPMAIQCGPEDEGCVPTYAVACPAPSSGDSGAAPPMGPPLSVQEAAWCQANASPSADSAKR